MSHRHSFNTQPRVRARQKSALERWEARIKECAREISNGQDQKGYWSHRAKIAHEQRDILRRKVG